MKKYVYDFVIRRVGSTLSQTDGQELEPIMTPGVGRISF